ncbi:helix-turn-helix transcriptional regulator [Bacillus toyonensis]|uniref:Helix-turn-helix domain-containing protein n=1 Tax=Bacillus toyonensis TaxID=155322 RepID=A0AAP8JVM8_9BACI|nr:helix-turn-helix transcriptional regulator [Bacillus toyonensis]PEB94652.1 hypothetical protein CON81_03600 [Bacillus toyonensis]PHE08759.1 hypothetical protein COF62_24260 [Bacillus toyonensis]PHG38449.1 hypothetical protein COI60_05540 [Bacillus toyonensis]HDR6286400.1 helix-turn-helix transcriptional regulator [Bacillus cereus]
MALTEDQREAQQAARVEKRKLISQMAEKAKAAGEQPLYNKYEQETQDQVSFVRTPANLFHYMNMQPYGFTADTLFIYQIIVQYFRKEEKYAYPSQYALSKLLKKNLSTVKRHVALLRDVGLIRIINEGRGTNNRYQPLVPLTESELFQRFPLAKKFEQQFSNQVDEFKARDIKRLEERRSENK